MPHLAARARLWQAEARIAGWILSPLLVAAREALARGDFAPNVLPAPSARALAGLRVGGLIRLVFGIAPLTAKVIADQHS